MMNILKSILNACVSGLMALGRVATWPLRALGGGGGMPGIVPPPDVVEIENDPIAERERSMQTGAAMAEIVLAWAANSIVDDAPSRLPDGMTDELKAWVRGLSREECEIIVGAEEYAISAHIQGVFALAGVRTTGPLPTADWGYARTRSNDFEPLVSDEASHGL